MILNLLLTVIALYILCALLGILLGKSVVWVQKTYESNKVNQFRIAYVSFIMMIGVIGAFVAQTWVWFNTWFS